MLVKTLLTSDVGVRPLLNSDVGVLLCVVVPPIADNPVESCRGVFMTSYVFAVYI